MRFEKSFVLPDFLRKSIRIGKIYTVASDYKKMGPPMSMCEGMHQETP